MISLAYWIPKDEHAQRHASSDSLCSLNGFHRAIVRPAFSNSTEAPLLSIRLADILTTLD